MEEPPSKIPDPLVDAMLEQGLLKAPAEPVNSQNTIKADPPSAADTAHFDSATQSHVPIDKGILICLSISSVLTKEGLLIRLFMVH